VLNLQGLDRILQGRPLVSLRASSVCRVRAGSACRCRTKAAENRFLVWRYKGLYDVQRAEWLRGSAVDRPVRLRRCLEGFTLSHCAGSYIRGCQFWLIVTAAGG
jgi:hypothetical protein